MSDSTMFAVLVGGAVLWIGLFIAEVIYNRCKKKEYERALRRRMWALHERDMREQREKRDG